MTANNEPLVQPEGVGFKSNDSVNPDDAIGVLLVRAGKLKQADLERVLKLQKEKNLRFGEAAIQLRLVTDKDVQRALAQQYQYPYVADSKSLSPKLIAALQPHDAVTDALRTARSQLLLGWFADGRKTLATGAASEREESGVLAANLAVLFAQMGKKTLLIDANLRKPGLHTLFKMNNSSGLSELLSGRVQHFAPIAVPSFPTLSLLSAGASPPNASELLLRAPASVFAGIAERYDIVLIDTPPARDSADFQIVAARAGGLLIATRRNLSCVADIADMKEKILTTGASVVGAVLSL